MISSHTKLINCFIGFTKRDKYYPSVLRSLGYSVDNIEPHFRNQDNDKVNPDLLLSSNKLHHTIIVECKGGDIQQKKEQIERYKKIIKKRVKW